MVNLRSIIAFSVPFVLSGPPQDPLSITNVECITTKGNFIVEVHQDWAPIGASHFLKLVADNFYSDIAIFRCVPNFLAQFGISADPSKKHWHNFVIPDDPHGDEMNNGLKKYEMSFAGGGKNSRSTHLFVAYQDLPGLGKSDWEVPFGVVTQGRDTIDSWYTGYGDMPPWGTGPEQGKLHNRGNKYIHEEYPLLDFIKSCSIIQGSPDTAEIEDKTLRRSATASLSVGAQEDGSQGLDTESDELRARKAFTAVAVLVVAITLLLCLYKYSTVSEGKSQ